MTAFEIYINNELACVAGLNGEGFLTNVLNRIYREDDAHEILHFEVGGGESISEPKNLKSWVNQNLRIGDEIVIKIREANSEEISEPIAQKTN
jgi:hypothetical protein